YEQCLEQYKELNNKRMMAHILNNVGNSYRMKGESDRALECLEQSVALHQELGNIRDIAGVHDNLIVILIDRGDLERAQISLHDLEQLNSQLKDKQINSQYLLDKALVLKTSPRAIKRGKAEEILKQLLEDKDLYYEFTIGALLNLCELLLIELRMINDVKVLDEINPLIARLLDIAEKSHSYWILSEAYLLQAKLSLLTFDIRKAQRFLTQAHQIAERFDLDQLAVKIANEKEDLLTKLDLWEKLEAEDAPMSDRMKLARLDEKIIKMIQKRPLLTVQVSEEKITVSKEKKICLVCKGEVFGFSYICKCGANYCENCARALTNLENVCWACDVPIDYSKPVKPFKEEAERIKVQKKAKKKNKEN
ncbi:MAG: tetratricopeptide repeat protein, partial [Candidatus Lokiarchaeota archaeon]|nr:tetratricopeptide repeat protein [Candidatus Lokiarchaeota archaeon]